MANVISKKYLIASILMLVFVVFDLTFDYLFDFENSDCVAFVFTLLSAVIVFFCTAKIRKYKLETKFDNYQKFITSNFDSWQVVFSILDIICGIISILSSLVVIGGLFKAIKVLYIPTKIAVIANKSKSLTKIFTSFSLGWSITRLFQKNNKNKERRNNNKMAKIWKFFQTIGQWIWSNKKSIIGTLSAIFAGVATAITANMDLIVALPDLYWFDINWTGIIAGVVIFGLTELGVTGKGFEAIKTYITRKADEKTAKTEAQKEKAKAKAQAIVDAYEKAKAVLSTDEKTEIVDNSNTEATVEATQTETTNTTTNA